MQHRYAVINRPSHPSVPDPTHPISEALEGIAESIVDADHAIASAGLLAPSELERARSFGAELHFDDVVETARAAVDPR